MSISASLTFDLDPSGTLVFEGSAADATTYGLVNLNVPPMLARTSYAPPGQFMHGLVSTASTWEHTSIVATVLLTADTAAHLEAAKQATLAAIGRLSYTATTEQNGVEITWRADRGSMALAALAEDSLTFVNLRRLFEVYRLVIPVNPIPVDEES